MSDIDQPSWVEIFQAHADRVKAGIHTAMPGTVVSYDDATQTASVQVGIQVESEDDSGFSVMPPLDGIPVAWPAGGTFAITMPLAAGDPCLLVFLEADDSAHRASGLPEAPRSLRRHGLCARCVPCGGLDGKTRPATAGKLTISSVDGAGPGIVLDATAVHLGGTTGEQFVALANLVSAELHNISTTLLSLAGATFGTPYTPGSVAASQVKAK